MRALFLTFTDPISPEKDPEYHQWYDNEHIPAILKLEGFVRASRWKLSSSSPASEALAEHQYLTVYELDTDDLPAAFARLNEARADGKMGSSVGIVSSEPPPINAVFEQLPIIER